MHPSSVPPPTPSCICTTVYRPSPIAHRLPPSICDPISICLSCSNTCANRHQTDNPSHRFPIADSRDREPRQLQRPTTNDQRRSNCELPPADPRSRPRRAPAATAIPVGHRNQTLTPVGAHAARERREKELGAKADSERTADSGAFERTRQRRDPPPCINHRILLPTRDTWRPTSTTPTVTSRHTQDTRCSSYRPCHPRPTTPQRAWRWLSQVRRNRAP